MCRFAIFLLVVPAVAEPTKENEASRLVRRLGSESYAEREAAMKALHEMGEKALAPLRAAKGSPDAEIRRRVTQLLGPLEAKVRMREIAAIKDSKLTPREKGRKLMPYLTKAMSYSDVERILGKGYCLHSAGNEDGYGVAVFNYKKYCLDVCFNISPPRVLILNTVDQKQYAGGE